MFGQVRPACPGVPGERGVGEGFQRLVGVGGRVAGTECSGEALGARAKIS